MGYSVNKNNHLLNPLKYYIIEMHPVIKCNSSQQVFQLIERMMLIKNKTFMKLDSSLVSYNEGNL